MSDEKTNVISNDLLKLFSNNRSDLFDYVSQRKLIASQDELYSNTEDTYTGICVSGRNAEGSILYAGSFTYDKVEKFTIKFRFFGEDTYRNGVLTRDPMSSGLTEQEIKIHTNLCANAIVTDTRLLPSYGDIMVIRQSVDGKYYVEEIIGNINQPTSGPSDSSFLNKLYELVKRGGIPLGDDYYSVEDFDQYKFPSKDYDTTISPAQPYTENRVILGHYHKIGMPCSNPLVVDTGYGKKAHKLLVKRFHLLQQEFIKDVAFSGGEGFIVTSGCRPAKFKTRAEYEQWAINSKYGSVKEARKWVAFASPHQSALAIDIKHRGKKPYLYAGSSEKEKSGHNHTSLGFRWMKNNAHRWGFTPYKGESWHWELKIPYDSWKSGEEFVDETVPNPNYAVRVTEKRKAR